MEWFAGTNLTHESFFTFSFALFRFFFLECYRLWAVPFCPVEGAQLRDARRSFASNCAAFPRGRASRKSSDSIRDRRVRTRRYARGRGAGNFRPRSMFGVRDIPGKVVSERRKSSDRETGGTSCTRANARAPHLHSPRFETPRAARRRPCPVPALRRASRLCVRGFLGESLLLPRNS